MDVSLVIDQIDGLSQKSDFHPGIDQVEWRFGARDEQFEFDLALYHRHYFYSRLFHCTQTRPRTPLSLHSALPWIPSKAPTSLQSPWLNLQRREPKLNLSFHLLQTPCPAYPEAPRQNHSQSIPELPSNPLQRRLRDPRAQPSQSSQLRSLGWEYSQDERIDVFLKRKPRWILLWAKRILVFVYSEDQGSSFVW